MIGGVIAMDITIHGTRIIIPVIIGIILVIIGLIVSDGIIIHGTGEIHITGTTEQDIITIHIPTITEILQPVCGIQVKEVMTEALP